jgi:hypothetical protein
MPGEMIVENGDILFMTPLLKILIESPGAGNRNILPRIGFFLDTPIQTPR